MNKKAGILTFHRAVNYGAVLQTFALQKFMNDNGIAAEVIDYKNEHIEKSSKAVILDKNIKAIIYNLITYREKIIRKRKFQNFIKNNIKLSQKEYTKSDIKESEKVYNEFWVGSDQVWNTALTDRDYTYLLNFCDKCGKYSYAASIGKGTIDEDEKEIFKRYLSRYNAVSVREKSNVSALKEFIDIPVNVVPDPTLLLSEDIWEKILVNPDVHERYILVYKINDSNTFQFAEKLSKEKKMKVIVLQAPHRKVPKAFVKRRTDSPEEWIGWIKNAAYVVTDSFHGTVFSIMFKKQFMAITGYNSKGNKNTRIDNILDMCGLNERLSDSLNTEAIDNNIDYAKVNETLKVWIDRAKRFILTKGESR